MSGPEIVRPVRRAPPAYLADSAKCVMPGCTTQHPACQFTTGSLHCTNGTQCANPHCRNRKPAGE